MGALIIRPGLVATGKTPAQVCAVSATWAVGAPSVSSIGWLARDNERAPVEDQFAHRSFPAVTFAFANEVTFAAGGHLAVISPGSQGGILADISITFLGKRT